MKNCIATTVVLIVQLFVGDSPEPLACNNSEWRTVPTQLFRLGGGTLPTALPCRAVIILRTTTTNTHGSTAGKKSRNVNKQKTSMICPLRVWLSNQEPYRRAPSHVALGSRRLLATCKQRLILQDNTSHRSMEGMAAVRKWYENPNNNKTQSTQVGYHSCHDTTRRERGDRAGTCVPFRLYFGLCLYYFFSGIFVGTQLPTVLLQKTEGESQQ